MLLQPATPRLTSSLIGPHKPSEETQAVMKFQHLLQVIDDNWGAITAQ